MLIEKGDLIYEAEERPFFDFCRGCIFEPDPQDHRDNKEHVGYKGCQDAPDCTRDPLVFVAIYPKTPWRAEV